MADDARQTLLLGGDRLPGYEVLRVLGAGAFGNVYLCTTGSGAVAVREYMPRGLAVRAANGQVRPQSVAAEGAFADGLQRYLARAERMASLEHPNLVRIRRVFVANGTGYVAMDYVAGDSLSTVLGDGGTLPEGRWIELLVPVMDALAFMHAAGTAHGNIGPGSVLVRDDSTPVLLGLAVPPRDEFGTVSKPGYAPIEHYSATEDLGGPVADVYSLAAVMYRCAAGVAPPEAPVRAERDTLVPAVRAGRGRCGRRVLASIDEALALQPSERSQSVDALRTALADSGLDSAPGSAAHRGARAAIRGTGGEAGSLAEGAAAGAAAVMRRVRGAARRAARAVLRAAQAVAHRLLPAARAALGRAAPAAAELWTRVSTGVRRIPPGRLAVGTGAVGVAVAVGMAIWVARGPAAPPPEVGERVSPPPGATTRPGEPADLVPEAPATPPADAVADAAVPPVDSAADEAEPPTPAETVATAPDPATLVVDSSPRGAEVVVDGEVVGETPVELADLPAGAVAVSLRHPHYETLEVGAIELAAGELLRVERELVRATGALSISTGPALAWIELDGARLADATPATLEGLPAGPARLTLGAEGYVSTVVDVDVPKNALGEFAFELERVQGSLTLRLAPADAVATLPDLDSAYEAGMRLPSGRHRLTVERDGYETVERTVNVSGDTVVEVALSAIRHPFTVTTDPASAQVVFANAEETYAPGVLLRPGEYNVRATLRGYAPWRDRVRHGLGPTTLAVVLEFVSAEYADELLSGGSGPEMVVVPAGRFRMGCASGDGCAAAELPLRPVAFDAPFAVSKYEVTFAEYDRFAAATDRPRPDAAGWGRSRRPVVNVSWHDAVAYTEWLTAETGRVYTLPSEAEWEYAARAGSDTPFAWGDTAAGTVNCLNCGPSRGRTLPVGSFEANAWGLHDMHGNVWEWVQDCWSEDHGGARPDGAARTAPVCGHRTLRGGSWFNAETFARSASRLSGESSLRGIIAGFRVVGREE